MNQNEETGLAAVTHILGLVTGFLGPLIVFLVKQEEGLVRDQAREALNFQITVLIGLAVSWVLAFVVIGFLLMAVVLLADLVFCIMAAVAANNGEQYRYPVCLRLIKGPEAVV